MSDFPLSTQLYVSLVRNINLIMRDIVVDSATCLRLHIKMVEIFENIRSKIPRLQNFFCWDVTSGVRYFFTIG